MNKLKLIEGILVVLLVIAALYIWVAGMVLLSKYEYKITLLVLLFGPIAGLIFVGLLTPMRKDRKNRS